MRAAVNTYLYLSPSPNPEMGGDSYVSGVSAMHPSRNPLCTIVANAQAVRFAVCASQFRNSRR
jgi:hypothetical protein